MGTHGKGVGYEHLTVVVENLHLGDFRAVAAFDDNLVFKTRLLVDVDAVVDVFDKVVVMELTAHFGYDNGIERVPFANHITNLHFIAVVEEELRTIGDVGVGEHHVGDRVEHAHFGKTSDNHLHGLAVGADLFGGYGTEFLDFEVTVITRLDAVDGCDVRRNTTDVERTECELCTGFAN